MAGLEADDGVYIELFSNWSWDVMGYPFCCSTSNDAKEVAELRAELSLMDGIVLTTESVEDL